MRKVARGSISAIPFLSFGLFLDVAVDKVRDLRMREADAMNLRTLPAKNPEYEN